jgi:hypothetical protein
MACRSFRKDLLPVIARMPSQLSPVEMAILGSPRLRPIMLALTILRSTLFGGLTQSCTSPKLYSSTLLPYPGIGFAS